jgi:NADH-quinone oxidoreductase subunit N
MGLAAGTAFGVQAMLVYMSIYVTMNIGVFAFILLMEKDGQPVTEISALNMYSKNHPGRALTLLVLMFSLAGVPPFLGFFGKLFVWQAALASGLGWLVVASAVASAIGAYYYLRIVFLMYFGDDKSDALDKNSGGLLGGFLVASAVIMVAGIFNMFGVEGAAALAAQTLVQ